MRLRRAVAGMPSTARAADMAHRSSTRATLPWRVAELGRIEAGDADVEIRELRPTSGSRQHEVWRGDAHVLSPSGTGRPADREGRRIDAAVRPSRPGEPKVEQRQRMVKPDLARLWVGVAPWYSSDEAESPWNISAPQDISPRSADRSRTGRSARSGRPISTSLTRPSWRLNALRKSPGRRLADGEADEGIDQHSSGRSASRWTCR